MEHFFSPNSSSDLRSDAHKSQIIGGDADEDHTQTIGEDISPGFRHPWFPPRQPRYCFGICYAFKYNNSTKCQFWTYGTKSKVIGKFVTVSMWKGETSEEVKMFRKHATPLQHPIDFFDLSQS